MTTYTAIATSEIDVDSPAKESVFSRLRDNALAIQEGDPTAPKIFFQALRAQTFTSSGTFNVPAGVTSVKVEVIGGGGAGGGVSGGAADGGGGNGGYAEEIVSVTPSTGVSVTIGAGGVAAGGNGGTSSFGAFLSATGGNGGSDGFGGTGGNGIGSPFGLKGADGVTTNGGGRGFGSATSTSSATDVGSGGSDKNNNGVKGRVRVWF